MNGVVVPAELWTTWTLDPGLLVGLGGLAVVYLRAVRGLWHSGGRRVGISSGRVVLFAAGMAVLLVALVSPLDALAEALFSAHMVQHLLLTLVAAPLLVAGRLPLVLRPFTPVAARRRLARELHRGPRRSVPLALVVAAVVHAAVVIGWHVPALYDLAVRRPEVHALEHLTMLAGAMVFWAAMGAGRHRAVPAAGLASFGVALSSIGLAAALTVAPAPWFAAHLASAPAWGLSALQDQQLAAAIMWIPGGLVYLAAAAGAVVRWLGDDERANAVATHLH